MEETTPTTGSTPPAPRLPVRKSRPAGLQTNRTTSTSSLSPTNIHAYAPWALVAAVIILALAVLGVISVPGQRSEAWQAVFLTNGQAYFGHVARVTPNWLVLRDVHYIQTTPQPGTAGQPAPAAGMTLVKLGNELHGPMNEMRINREHVLLTEVLRDDSAVVQTIEAARKAATEPSTPAEPEASAPTTNAAPSSE
ncbi:MAG: hypothetical protein Q8R16_02940 [bacterium]|nr:hypothetical protein [bacterium]